MLLVELPEAILSRIAAFVLHSCNSAVTLCDSSSSLPATVVLSRVHPALRHATAGIIREISMLDRVQAWPAMRALSPVAWPGLEVLRVNVDRSRFCGFLKWLVGATGIRTLEINVSGAPYEHSRLWMLEKKLLGRLFTHVGPSLHFLKVAGIDSKTLLLSVVCQCSQLESLSICYYSSENVPDEDSTTSSRSLVASLFLNTCLLNRDTLKHVSLPFNASDLPDDGATLRSMVESTWATVWGNYCAGVKEAAANLPASEAELARMFENVKSRTELVDEKMSDVLLEFRNANVWTHLDLRPKPLVVALAPNLKIVETE